LRVSGFGPLLVCSAGLGLSFGASSVAVPAYALERVGSGADSVAAVLLGIWGIGSAVGGVWFGARRPSPQPVRQFAWLLLTVGANLAVLALMPTVTWLGVALVLGGVTIAPAIILANALVGRIIPASMHNEAYTWLITLTIAGSAAGSAVTGLFADRGWLTGAFVFAGASSAAMAAVAAWPSGSLSRAVGRPTATSMAHPATV
jgi:MFS family permease